MTDPRKVQGSDADRAEGGLDVEAAFAAVDDQTATRLGREARAVQEERTKSAPAEGSDA